MAAAAIMKIQKSPYIGNGLTDRHSNWHDDAHWPAEPDQELNFYKSKKADGRHLEKSKNVVLMDIVNSLLKTGNKTANINVKKTAFYTHC